MNGTFTNLSPTQLTQAAAFIADLNNRKTSHIGYCGTSYNDILHTLQEDFVDQSTTLIYAQLINDEIVSLIALDIDDDAAEVWGPFTKQQNENDLFALWQYTKNHHPTITHYQFFINELNTQQIKFMDVLGAKKSGEHCYLNFTRDTFEPVSIQLSSRYTDVYELPFSDIHTEAFPKTYYNAETILRKITEDDQNCLKLVIRDGEVLGYAYYQLDLEERTAHIEYIAIKPSEKGKGLGTTLLKEVCTHIFTHPEVQHISLTVDNTNKAAINIYLKAGFMQVNVLWAYNLKEKKKYLI